MRGGIPAPPLDLGADTNTVPRVPTRGSGGSSSSEIKTPSQANAASQAALAASASGGAGSTAPPAYVPSTKNGTMLPPMLQTPTGPVTPMYASLQAQAMKKGLLGSPVSPMNAIPPPSPLTPSTTGSGSGPSFSPQSPDAGANGLMYAAVGDLNGTDLHVAAAQGLPSNVPGLPMPTPSLPTPPGAASSTAVGADGFRTPTRARARMAAEAIARERSHGRRGSRTGSDDGADESGGDSDDSERNAEAEREERERRRKRKRKRSRSRDVAPDVSTAGGRTGGKTSGGRTGGKSSGRAAAAPAASPASSSARAAGGGAKTPAGRPTVPCRPPAAAMRPSRPPASVLAAAAAAGGGSSAPKRAKSASDANRLIKRRKRFKPEQLAMLELEFSHTKTPPGARLLELAQMMNDNVTKEQVKVWFQNRRQKQKKLEALAEAGVTQS